MVGALLYLPWSFEKSTSNRRRNAGRAEAQKLGRFTCYAALELRLARVGRACGFRFEGKTPLDVVGLGRRWSAQMLMNEFERALVRHPLRAIIQRRIELPLIRSMLKDESVKFVGLEIGCGCGHALEVVKRSFRLSSLDAFDLDSNLIRVAAQRNRTTPSTKLWVGDVTAIPVAGARYDMVIDFAMLHHVTDWSRALTEVYRVMKPGGVFVGEEVLRPLIDHPITRRLLVHPRRDRFDAGDLEAGLRCAGFQDIRCRSIGRILGMFFARKSPESNAATKDCAQEQRRGDRRHDPQHF